MEFNEQELKAIREEWCPGASDSQFELFISEAKARNLRPGTHLFFMLRNTNEWDPTIGAKVRKNKATWITKIDAFRLISQRTGKDAGRGKTRWIYLDDQNNPSIESTVPLPHPTKPHVPREPYACVVPIYRSDYKEPIEIVCRFDAYAVTMRSGDGITLTEMWQRRGPEQLEKCTESSTRRAAYPEEFGSLYLLEELKDDEPVVTTVQPTASVVLAPAPSAPIVPPVNQIPATATDAPRPGEEKPIPTLVELILDKPAAPEPEKKKAGRPKKEVIPDSERRTANDAPDGLSAEPKRAPHDREDLGITDADITLAGPSTKLSVEEDAALLADSHAFVEDVSSVTPVPDRLPTKEQKEKFTAHARELIAAGVDNKLLGDYIIGRANKKKSSDLTVGEWESAFEVLDAAKEAGTLKEVVKPV